ncbi:MAG: type IV-A pilus assembly ATPase PilB [Nitrospirae bacterium GWC2_57_13]|nr:MAG: type IV-A pilus assembly ATPase PilB [Nitrospirae bacterium GWC2_57_13]HAS55648.1 type IV-A pilus assembly ATPase PilB [Nitrospiraceae bacterium]
MAGRLGTMLVSSGLITEDQLKQALAMQQREGGRLGSILVKMSFVPEDKLMMFLSKQYGVPYVDLSRFDIDQNIVKLIPADVAQKYQIMPINRTGATITIAMVDPSNVFAIDDVKFMTGYNVEPVVATEGGIKGAIGKYYSLTTAIEKVMTALEVDDKSVGVIHDDEEKLDVAKLKAEVEDAPVVKLVNLILTDAVQKGASDIHIEAYEKSFRVRYRIDGSLYEVMSPPMKLRAALTSRLKIMAELDIAERRLPQDGRIKLKIKDKEVDLRVSVLPCLFGEKIVMRILDKSNLMLDLRKLGFEAKAMKDFMDAISSPYGMVLVTGPTGSGKSTTLYSALQQINTIDVNIMTAEDPVEYNLMGVNQVQMKDDIGLNFAAALRSFLRQDPDIVMVGEIRDYETAEIAVKAALTGHLVLSTLHTNDAPSTVNRLLNMGVEPFLVSSSVVLILAQRLVRKVCQNCKKPEKLPVQIFIDAGFTKEEAVTVVSNRGEGCTTCNNTGYKGRVALYEVMPVNEEIKELILQGASAIDIKKSSIKTGMQTLRMSGLSKVKEGLTSLEEVVGSTFSD